MLRGFAALQRTGMPVSHGRVFQDVANRMDCVISSRAVGPAVTQLLEEGYATKGFHNKAKSCPWGPMAGFVQELAADGRAVRFAMPGGKEPDRWILAEEAELYRRAFGLEETGPAEVQAAGEAVLARFLDTHALVGLRDILERYPFERGWTERQLEEWAATKRVVTVPAEDGSDALQWSAPANLEQVQRGSLALLRRHLG